MNGMYTCPERIERDGFLIAFEGQVMSMDEAVTLGLIDLAVEPEPEPELEPEPEPEPEPEQKPRAKKGTAK
ncbi:MAG: hypothetical protein IJ111_02070 [Eggerthellaceae bacterium]|nr:hypothetical protein [Eggerthellaceae bacterium]